MSNYEVKLEKLKDVKKTPPKGGKVLADGQVFELRTTECFFEFNTATMEAVKILQENKVCFVDTIWDAGYDQKFYFWTDPLSQLALRTKSLPSKVISEKEDIFLDREGAEKVRDAFDVAKDAAKEEVEEVEAA